MSSKVPSRCLMRPQPDLRVASLARVCKVPVTSLSSKSCSWGVKFVTPLAFLRCRISAHRKRSRAFCARRVSYLGGSCLGATIGVESSPDCKNVTSNLPLKVTMYQRTPVPSLRWSSRFHREYMRFPARFLPPSLRPSSCRVCWKSSAWNRSFAHWRKSCLYKPSLIWKFIGKLFSSSQVSRISMAFLSCRSTNTS